MGKKIESKEKASEVVKDKALKKVVQKEGKASKKDAKAVAKVQKLEAKNKEKADKKKEDEEEEEDEKDSDEEMSDASSKSDDSGDSDDSDSDDSDDGSDDDSDESDDEKEEAKENGVDAENGTNKRKLEVAVDGDEASDEKYMIFVGGVNFRSTEEDVRMFFNDCGEITRVKLPINMDGRPKGIAFVSFATEEARDQALKLNGEELMGRYLDIEIATGEKFRRMSSPASVISKTAFVANLAWTATEDDVSNHFQDCGEITGCRIVYDRDSGNSKGMAYIDFADEEGAKKAVELTGTNIAGRDIRVDFAQPRSPGGGRGGGRGGRGGGRGRGGGGYGGGRGGGGGYGGDRGYGGGRGGGRGGGYGGGRDGGRDGGYGGGRGGGYGGGRGGGRDGGFGGRGRGRGGSPRGGGRGGSTSFQGKKISFDD